eukprot:5788789-Amphidinium_carterae.1
MVLQILRHGGEEFGYIELAGDDSEIEEYIPGVQDCLVKKAAGTIKIRAGFMLLYIAWCATRDAGLFPAEETLCYKYVCSFRQLHVP